METRAPKIKFCGLTRAEDAAVAVSLDAWAVGMILWSGSARACDPAAAVEIAADCKRKAEIVGVFVNPTLDEVAQAADGIGLTIVQLHGDEGPMFCDEVVRRTGCRVIKAARIRERSDLQAIQAFRRADFHLLDSSVPGMRGGTGTTFEWQLVRGHRHSRVPVILSGGLTPANVAEAIGVVDPYAVDVASGVESAPGVKDHAAMRAFAEAVRAPTEPAAPDVDPAPEAMSEPAPEPRDEAERDPLRERIEELERAARPR